jgi:tryptophan synthase alpha subunit
MPAHTTGMLTEPMVALIVPLLLMALTSLWTIVWHVQDVDGFIVVDLPPEQGTEFVSKAICKEGLAHIPTTTDKRINYLSFNASSFIYCIFVTGVAGARGAFPSDLKEFVNRIRLNSKLTF